MSNNTVLIKETSQQSSPLDSILKPFMSPMAMGCFALIIVLLILKNIQPQKSVLGKARFATSREVKQGCEKGKRQIAAGKTTKSALELADITLADVQPAVAVIGRSGEGKTTNVADEAIKSAIDQGWTNLVFDIKGDFVKKHAAYALSKGYKVFHYYPGHPCDGLNFLEFMADKHDAKTAEEIAKIMEANFGEPGERKDGFFSPQAVAALRLAFMMAKATCYPDLVTAWKFLSLPNFAKRLAKAHELGLLREDLDFGTWISEASTSLRSMAESGRTIDGILGTSMTNFQRMIDPSIVPCLINNDIPLDLNGKEIIFFQLDEEAQSATAPLVATAINMLLVRNLKAGKVRSNPLGLFLDEFDSIYLPNIQNYITKMRSYGLVAMLSYQSNAQVYRRYSKDRAISILSSCPTKIYFNSGHTETAEQLAKSLGKTEVKFKTQSRSYGGKQPTRSISEHLQVKDLLEAHENQEQMPGEVVAISPGWKNRAYKHKFKLNEENQAMWNDKCIPEWNNNVLPFRIEKIKERDKDSTVEIINREVIADCNMPKAKELEVWGEMKIMAATQ